MKKILTAIILGAVLMLSGCTISQSQVETGQSLCKENGGIRYFSLSAPHVNVLCNNGAFFQTIGGDN